MKKEYLKPEVEYISFEAEDIITKMPDGGMNADSTLPDGWEEV